MIGIIGAMEEEVSQLIEAMENKEKVTCAGMDFYSGTLKGKDAVVVQSGIERSIWHFAHRFLQINLM